MVEEPWYTEAVLFVQRFLHALGLYQRGKIFNRFACKIRGNYWDVPLWGGYKLEPHNYKQKIARDLRTGKPVDFWARELTPEATMEHTAKCYESLEKQGKLKIPAGKKGGIPHGVCPDAEEFKKEYADYQAGKEAPKE